MIKVTLNGTIHEINEVVDKGNMLMAKCPLHKTGGNDLCINIAESICQCFNCLASGKAESVDA